jgi:hypothetical protein
MPTLANDLAYGLTCEDSTKPILEELFNTPLTKLGGYSPLDYTNEGKTLWAELKTRRIAHNQYPTALIGTNKIRFCDNNNVGARHFFVFKYTDGFFYIEYNREVFAGFERSMFERSHRTDALTDTHEVAYIPTELLIPFSTPPVL